jgi:hypothetical protein
MNQYSLSRSGKTAPRAIKIAISGLSKNNNPIANATQNELINPYFTSPGS